MRLPKRSHFGPKGPWKNIVNSFWSKVDQTPGFGPKGKCWRWTGVLNSEGYGMIWVYELGRTIGAHRVAFKLKHGHYPEPCGLHTCDTPSCVRYSHIYEGTKKDNCQDMFRRGRANRPRGSRNVHNKLSISDVHKIRRLLSLGLRKSEIAEQFGVDRKSIFHIEYGKTFAYLAEKTHVGAK